MNENRICLIICVNIETLICAVRWQPKVTQKWCGGCRIPRSLGGPSTFPPMLNRLHVVHTVQSSSSILGMSVDMLLLLALKCSRSCISGLRSLAYSSRIRLNRRLFHTSPLGAQLWSTTTFLPPALSSKPHPRKFFALRMHLPSPLLRAAWILMIKNCGLRCLLSLLSIIFV